MTLRGRLAIVRPRSFEARVALAIVVALVVVFAIVQLIVVGFAQARARAALEDELRQQATSIARVIDAAGPDQAARGARAAQAYVGDARMVVYVDGEVVHWNTPVRRLEASGTGRSGPVTVLLQRSDASAGLFTDAGFVVLVATVLVGTGALIWYLARGVGARLRRQVEVLADTAEAVAEGRLDVRAPTSEDELGRLAQALNRMTERLERADARQREFLADVAHELRTPVTSIEGFATALGDGTARSDEDRRESAQFIRQEAARLRDLVRDLQSVTVGDLAPPVAPEPMDLGEAARRAVARLGRDAEARGVALSTGEGTAPVTADPLHVDTILVNLLSNAIAATPPGGSVELAPVRRPGEAGIAVRDTGAGIAAEHLPYIFDRLYRVQPGRDRGAGGSGLGLSIVRRLATLLGGYVEVESEPGAGSTFTLWLDERPVAPPRRATVGSGPV